MVSHNPSVRDFRSQIQSRPTHDRPATVRDPAAETVPGCDSLREEETRLEIYRRHTEGETIEQLSNRFGCSKSRIYRALAQVQHQRVVELPLDYIPNDHFRHVGSKQEQAIAGPPPENEHPPRKIRPPAGLPPYLASLYETPLLTREQEVHLFRKLNYLKYKASKLREKLDPKQPSVTAMRRIEDFHEQSVSVKNEITRANLRLVVAIAKRYANNPEELFELISEGNMSLMRAVEKFDFGRGFRFSTYATWAVMKNFARSIPTEQRHRARFQTTGAEMLATTEDVRADHYEKESAQAEHAREVSKVLHHLDQREQEIIRYRFGIGEGREPMTLKQVGAKMGVTKERIRQLESRAMAKLREAARQERVEAPEPA